MNEIIINAVANETVETDLADKFLNLFPSWETILATVLAITILLFVLTKLVWKPVKKFVDERQKFIQANIDSSTKQSNDAIDDRKKANQELNTARLTAEKIIEDARKKAQLTHDKIIQETHNQTRNIFAETEKEIIKEKNRVKVNARTEMVSIALEAAKKILEKDVDEEVNRRLIEEFIKDHD